MKIAVFGDSFAAKNGVPIWWYFLQTQHGHDVTSFGEGGSSISWSAQLILQHFKDFDFVIWCVTSSNRLTIRDRNNFEEITVHVTGGFDQKHKDPAVQHKIDISQQYILHVMDHVDQEFVSRCMVEYVRNHVPNLLLIPCFATPLYPSVEESGFNLYNLYEKETRFYFPTQDLFDIQKKYIDGRIGHFCESTQLILAQQIADSLQPGVFSSDYDLFPEPNMPFEEIFIKR